jgi:hypothetical protein
MWKYKSETCLSTGLTLILTKTKLTTKKTNLILCHCMYQLCIKPAVVYNNKYSNRCVRPSQYIFRNGSPK